MAKIISCVAICIGWAGLPVASAAEWRGFASVEYRGFVESPADPDQRSHFPSLVVQPEFYQGWDAGRQALTVTPFYRWDPYDPERTHADLRELFWMYAGKEYDVRIGMRKVFWGVTESQHLVDVINQTDLVENPDGEDKLGQPMVSATLFKEWGNLELYLLPYFRERTFPGEHGRLRTLPRVDTDAAVYESGRKVWHGDVAVRGSRSFDGWDVGLSYFYGTNREPLLVPTVNQQGEPVLVPYYAVIHQAGLDVQGVTDAWLWKLEAIYRADQEEGFAAMTAGFEYTFYRLFETGVDIGIVAEYLYDERGQTATTSFENDLMVGLRVTPNDVQSTDFLASVILDPSSGARVYSLEVSRRMTDHLTMALEARIFHGMATDDPLYSFRRDDYIQATAAYYF